MTDERALLRRTTELATGFLDTLDERPVFPTTSMEEVARGARRADSGRLRRTRWMSSS